MTASSPAPHDMPSGQITRTLLEYHDVPGTDLETRLYLITYPPNTQAPIHHHPAQGLGYVLQGGFESAFGDDPPQVYHAGESFQDLAEMPHTFFRSLDTEMPLQFLICYTLKKETPAIITP